MSTRKYFFDLNALAVSSLKSINIADGTVSRVVHATSHSPTGPFVRQGVALTTFAHNPQVVRAPDGKLLLFHIGAAVEPDCVPDCRRGFEHSGAGGRRCAAKGHGTSVAVATSAFGPWERTNYVLPKFTNPSPYVFQNGSVLLAARADGIHILRANTWRGPYESLGRIGAYEDPYLWRDSAGHFHMLSHDRNHTTDFFEDRGGYWSSANGVDGWSAPVDAYTTSVVWADGSTRPLNARQRPFLFFDDPEESGGSGGTFLFNGAGLPGAKSHWNFSFTFVQQLDTREPAVAV